MVLGVVLGFMIESNYRRSLLLTGGDHSIFYTDKVSLGLLVLAAVLTTLLAVARVRAAGASGKRRGGRP